MAEVLERGTKPGQQAERLGAEYKAVKDLEANSLPFINLEDCFQDRDVPSSDSDDEGRDKAKNPPVYADGIGEYLRKSLGELLLGRRMNVLLFLTPFAFAAKSLEWGDEYVFCFALLALVPFAERVSFVTEDVAKYTNDTLGGLLNASFGNVTELVICFYALRDGLIRVVQVSMLGSVLSNLLLVLGSAFLVGGIRHKEQRFNKVAAVTNSGLLIATVLALSLPSILDTTHQGTGSEHQVEVIKRAVDAPADSATHLISNVSHGAVLGPARLSGDESLQAEVLRGGDAPLWLSRFIAAAGERRRAGSPCGALGSLAEGPLNAC